VRSIWRLLVTPNTNLFMHERKTPIMIFE